MKLIVEVADSTLSDDLGDKHDAYAVAVLPEYWVADVKAKTVIRRGQSREGGLRQEEALRVPDQPIARLSCANVVVRI